MSTSFKAAIGSLLLVHGARAKPTLRSETERAAGKLAEGAGELRPAADLDAISASLANALMNGDALTGRQLRNCAWCLWTTRVAIAERATTLQPFLEQLRELRHKQATRALSLSYLIHFHADRPGLSSITEILRELVDVMGAPFDALHRHLRVFDETEGPRRIGDFAFTGQSSPRAVLEENGLRHEQVFTGGYVEPCARRVLERVADDRELPALERLKFVTSIAVKDGTRQLHFPSHKDLVANAMLLPYSGRDLRKDVRDKILKFLISLEGLGDPRTRGANWVNMHEARRIANSWLTEQALRQFLDVVEKVNPNPNWKYRRKFWETMHEREAIDEAWVVLDREGAAAAHRMMKDSAPFGQFSAGSGVQPGNAVLLLKIGRGVCAEWSIVGPCRFWNDAAHEGAPQLYNDRYNANLLKTGRHYYPEEEIVHFPHEGDNAWQHKIAKRIRSMTGARFSKQDYML